MTRVLIDQWLSLSTTGRHDSYNGVRRCGPCKVMYPMLVEMAEQQPDVVRTLYQAPAACAIRCMPPTSACADHVLLQVDVHILWFASDLVAVAEQAFAKLNCNKYNKELGVQLGVKVAPTFQLYKNSVKVAEMTGAKIDALKELVAKHK